MSCQGFEHLFAADQGFCWPCFLLIFFAPSSFAFHFQKYSMSFFLCEVIRDSGAIVASSAPVRAHSIRSVATSVSFLRNGAVSKVLEAATWKSNSVFASFYLNDISYVFEGLRSLGPFVSLIIFHFRLLCLWYVRFYLFLSDGVTLQNGPLTRSYLRSCSSSATWSPFGTSKGLIRIFSWVIPRYSILFVLRVGVFIFRFRF